MWEQRLRVHLLDQRGFFLGGRQLRVGLVKLIEVRPTGQ